MAIAHRTRCPACNHILFYPAPDTKPTEPECLKKHLAICKSVPVIHQMTMKDYAMGGLTLDAYRARKDVIERWQ